MSKTGKFTEMESRLVVASSLEWLQIQGYFWGDENSQIRQWWFSNNFVNILKATEMSTFQFSSVAQSSPTLCDPMNRSTPGLPVHHQLPESTQTHAHQVGDAIQPSHPVVPFSSCPQSLPASGSFPMSQLFTWGGQSTGVSASASVLPMNTQDWNGWNCTVCELHLNKAILFIVWLLKM